MNKRLLLLVAGAALLAASCVKVNLDIDVRDDGSARLSGIVALDAEALGDLAEGFGGRDELCSGFLEGTDLESDQETPDLETKPYEEDGFCGIEFSGELSAEEVDAQLGDLGTGQDMTLRREGDGWLFELPLDDANLGTEGLDDFGGLFDIEDLLGDAEYIVRVKLPGKQVDHNADFIEGDGTMVWEIDLLNPPARLFLQTEPGETETGSGGGSGDDGGGKGLILLIVVLALVGLGVAAYFLMRNKKPQGDAGPAVVPDHQGPPAKTSTTPVEDFAQPEPVAPPVAESTPSEEQATEQPSPEPEPQRAADPKVVASPTPEQATGSPVWDPVRRKYVQWDPTAAHWLTFDDTTQAWQPE